VTGTDTDVGKTRVTAALARALRTAGRATTIVKIVQTGVAAADEGDAARAGRLAGCRHVELARFATPADPWSAALAGGREPLDVATAAARIQEIGGSVVAEGAGGLMVPIGPREYVADVASAACLRAVIAVGLRLGCINHALLTVSGCERLGIAIAGAVLVERWESVERRYLDDVRRALKENVRILGIMPFSIDEEDGVRSSAGMFDWLLGGAACQA